MAPVTFKTKAYANILMLGDVAENMLDMMNFGRMIPGAIDVEDVPEALRNLEGGLASRNDLVESDANADEDQAAISLHTRAVPLLELLKAAVADETYVRWE